jgi:4-carboxymuconolactone decarboxylase
METRQVLFLTTPALLIAMLSACVGSHAQRPPAPIVRVAELEIDSAQLEKYRTALKEEIETSIRVEPGVLALYAVSLKDNPAQVRIFEVYASADAYSEHLKTPHFQRYKTGTQAMVKSLKLIETDPIHLGVKTR